MGFINTYHIHSLPNNKMIDFSKLNAFAEEKTQHTQPIFLTEGYKTLWEEDKMLVTNIFSYTQNVLKRLSP